jgi:hypothetical protein
MGKKGGTNKESGYGYERKASVPEVYVTAGGVLTPVRGFSGKGITGTPPAPQHRGFPKEPGDGHVPGGKGRKSGGNNAMKAFGLSGTGENEK